MPASLFKRHCESALPARQSIGNDGGKARWCAGGGDVDRRVPSGRS
ncbi:MAG: hypothetical protein KIT00_01805 [Rhodospirillales bacterium]|nr:hypothetical protein [Rhodospirillales bacterium]